MATVGLEIEVGHRAVLSAATGGGVDTSLANLTRERWRPVPAPFLLRGTKGGSIPTMTTLAALWLPILLSAVFVFLVSSVVHMALPIHKNDYQKLPDEAATLDAMRKTGVRPGQFMFPHPGSMKEMNSPAMQAKWKQGPVGTLIVRSGGYAMGASLGQWFTFSVVISVFCAYLTGLACAPGAAGSQVFRIAATVAVLGYCFTSVCDSIWKGVAWSTTWKFVFDGVLYALATGATFAWLWPAAA